MHEAATGAARKPPPTQEESGFAKAQIAGYLLRTAEQLQAGSTPETARPVFSEAARKLAELAGSVNSDGAQTAVAGSLESLEQHLVVLEDKLFAALEAGTSMENLVALREQSARELAPYRSRLQTVQIRQIEQQFLRRCLFEQNGVPRLSLFYMQQT